MTNQELQQVEREIEEAKASIDLGKAMERLTLNRDFKAVIVNGLLNQEAIRLVHLKAAPNQQSPEAQQSIARRMDAIGTLNQYLQELGQKVQIAEKSLADAEALRDEYLSEDTK